jgi:G3E family GTPase
VSKKSDLSARTPTHIITGFLGSGKTSTVLHLLGQRPAHEHWAVLVNEFGEVGIDRALIEGHAHSQGNVTVLEVPGGCMCCAASPLVFVMLSELLGKQQLDRLLVEPSGLGHPVEVLELLQSPSFCDVLSVQKIVTIVDARLLEDERHTEDPTFNQQVSIADVLVGNKRDLYRPGDERHLIKYAAEHAQFNATVQFTSLGALDLSSLLGPCDARASHAHTHATIPQSIDMTTAPIPECGWLRAENQAEGIRSVGWRFTPSWIFSRRRVIDFLRGIAAHRNKAVVVTDEGVFGYNRSSEALMEVELDECLESRVEIIAPNINDAWEAQLFACVSSR